MKNIYHSYGGVPIVFLRYNPDNYKVDNKLHKTAQVTREDTLIKWVIHIQNTIPEYDCYVKYLYYNNYQTSDITFLEIDPYKTDTFICPKCKEEMSIESIYTNHIKYCK